MNQLLMTQQTFSISEYIGIIKRRKWSLVLPAIIISLIGVLVALSLPPSYKSTSTILIEEQEIPQAFVTATVTSYAEQRLQTINQRIMSTSRLLEIINEYDLYEKLREKRSTEEIVERMKDDVSMNSISAEVLDRKTGRAMTATIAFNLSYEGTEAPKKVQKVATVLASLFLEENLKVRERQTQETHDFLEEEAVRVKEELKKIETELSDFKEKHINELPELLQANIQGLESMERNLERLVEQVRSLREREGYLEAQLTTVSPFIENQDRARLDTLRVELVHLETRFSSEYPDVVKTREEIASMEKKLADENKQGDDTGARPDNPAYITFISQLASVRADIESVNRQQEEYSKRVEEYQKRIEATPKVEEIYNTLLMAQANTQAKVSDLVQKTMEAKVAQGLEKEQKGERFTLIDPARLPEKPSKPNRFAIILVGCVFGLAAGAGLVALKEFSDLTVRKPEILTMATGFPVLALLPEIVTPSDRRELLKKKLTLTVASVMAFVIIVVVFHFFVMDLDIFWARIGRKFNTGVFM
jgi:polysaccharide chain length determinant protein (PEP-CTERM system associated)